MCLGSESSKPAESFGAGLQEQPSPNFFLNSISQFWYITDCVELHLYSEKRMRRFCGSDTGATKASLALQHFFGFESFFTLDRESNTLALLCRELIVVLAFEMREQLMRWQTKLAAQLGKSHQFSVLVTTGQRLPAGPARLHLLGRRFALTSGTTPRLLGSWELVHLRRYGTVDGRFCFEGGTLSGVHAGLHVLLADRPYDIVNAFDLAAAVKHRIYVQSDDVEAQFGNRIFKKLHLDGKSGEAKDVWATNVAGNVQQEYSRSPQPGRRGGDARCCSRVAKLGTLSPSSMSFLTPATSRLPQQSATVAFFKPTWKMEKNWVQLVERFLPKSPGRIPSECITQLTNSYKNYDKPKSIHLKGMPTTHPTRQKRPRHYVPHPHPPTHVYKNIDVARKIPLQTERDREPCDPTKIMRRSRSILPIDEDFIETYEIIRCSSRLRYCVTQLERSKICTETACTNCKRVQNFYIISAQEKLSEISNTMDHYLPMDPGVVYLRMGMPIDDLYASNAVILEELVRKRFYNFTGYEFQKRSRSAESLRFPPNLEACERTDTP
ncbi:Protein Dok-7 [Eumeta japonica]|uniref:Protein Dok-7 n=1 Tax=Eumeta variegata TaxID=151549 RepID=A0A4C1ZPX6_EUMVA|nr:Protein Dok-7 [Eumeta japonica]